MNHPPLSQSPTTTRPRIGLVLGGGGARGLGHVAILEVLDEMGVRPSIIAGTSIGALLGSAYAAGFSGAQIRAHLLETLGDRFYLVRQMFGARSRPLQRFWNLLPLRSALLDPEAMLNVVLPPGMPADITDCDIPLRIVATDMQAHQAETFSDGNLKRRLAASIAIPVVFSPVTIDGRVYADGGLANPLPLDAVAGHCDVVIGIDVTGERDTSTMATHPTIPTMLMHSLAIFQKSIIEAQLKAAKPDLYLALDVGRFHALQFNNPDAILAAAEPAKEEFRMRLGRLLNDHTRPVAGA